MIAGSICSGIGAPECAWRDLGIEFAFCSETESFPSAVLQHHYPEVENLGDFTRIGDGWAIDLLVGGTPCQDFSVAGLRAGMDGKRGQLTVEFALLAGRLRPQWLVWENVSGVLSIDQGRAFGIFLRMLGELGYGFAYRILDAQYFGVAQRRRRVFVVGYLGDWRRAAAVLFERESLSGHPAPRREAGEGTTYGVEVGPSGGGFTDTSPTLDARCKDGFIRIAVTHSLSADGFDASEDGTGRGTPLTVAPCLTQNYGKQPDNSDTGAGPMVIPSGMAVRRLTPRECERLQGFPDDYTLIEYNGKAAADGPRYKVLGNAMAVPVMRWIGERILAVEKLSECGVQG